MNTCHPASVAGILSLRFCLRARHLAKEQRGGSYSENEGRRAILGAIVPKYPTEQNAAFVAAGRDDVAPGVRGAL